MKAVVVAAAVVLLAHDVDAQRTADSASKRTIQTRRGEVDRAPKSTGLVFDGVSFSVRTLDDGLVEITARRPDRTVTATFQADSLARWVDSAARYVERRVTAANRDSLGAYEGPIVRGGHPGPHLSTLQLTPSDSTGKPGYMLYLQDQMELHLQPEVSVDEAKRFIAAVRRSGGGKPLKQ
jgi:hypothetical protein